MMHFTTKSEKVRKGDIICYRSHLARVLKVDEEGLWIQGPYIKQKIDWEDYEEWNR